MGAEYNVRVLWHLVEFGHEYRALRLQRLDHGAVMDDLMPDIDGRAIATKRFLDHADCPVYTGAKTTRPSQNDAHRAQSDWRGGGGQQL